MAPSASSAGAPSTSRCCSPVGRIVVISNPRSGRNKRDPELARRLRALLDPPHLLLEPEDPAHSDALAAELLSAGDLDILCVNGGDGTLAHVLSSVARVVGDRPMPTIGVLRGGTMNTIAHGIGLRGRPPAILRRILARHARGEPQPTTTRHLMRVRDGLGPDRYGFLFGNGVISNFLELYYEGGDPSPAKAARLLVRALLSGMVGGRLARRLTAPTPMTVSLDGQRWAPEAYMAVAAGTVDDLGFGFKGFWAVTRHLGSLQALGVTCSPFALALRIPGTLWGRPWNHPGIIDQLGRTLVVEGHGPQSYMIEGDFHRGGQRIEVGVGPPVRLICR
ncbi:MAG: diacylglycerol kinase [Deltaproteobacteria bacterium]|nr:MAG: diacylglycerol kinase [Deltaproteobacteria bacterium]